MSLEDPFPADPHSTASSLLSPVGSASPLCRTTVSWGQMKESCVPFLLSICGPSLLLDSLVPLSLTNCSVPAGQVPGGSQHPPWEHRGAKCLQALSSTHALCYRPAAPTELRRARKYSLNSPTVLGYHCCYRPGSYLRDEFSLLMSYTSWAEPVSC